MKAYGIPKAAVRGFDTGSAIDIGKIGGSRASRHRRKKVWKAAARREARRPE